jgi:hypothetical protein
MVEAVEAVNKLEKDFTEIMNYSSHPGFRDRGHSCEKCFIIEYSHDK